MTVEKYNIKKVEFITNVRRANAPYISKLTIFLAVLMSREVNNLKESHIKHPNIFGSS